LIELIIFFVFYSRLNKFIYIKTEQEKNCLLYIFQVKIFYPIGQKYLNLSVLKLTDKQKGEIQWKKSQ